jgi:type II secretory pathway component GspD/PulD (secretin)
MTASNAPTKRTREVAIQVPGAPADTQAPAGSDSAKIDTEAQRTREVAEIDAQRLNNLAATEDEQLVAGGIPEDVMARARAQVHAEMGEQLEAAAAVLKQATPTPLARGAYRNMRAADIDHTKLKAPVLSADGWVCPPAPAAKV